MWCSKPLTVESFLGKDLATVVVGDEDEQQRFYIHRELLCQRSPFFDAAFNGHFQEASTKVVSLSEDHPVAFSCIVHWLYTNQLPPITDDMQESCELTRPQMLLRIFSMGDRLFLPDLQDLCWTNLRQHFGTVDLPSADFLDDLYRLTDETSRLRTYFIQLCTHMIVSKTHEPDSWDEMLSANESFAADMARSLARGLNAANKERNNHPFTLNNFVHFRPEKEPRQPSQDQVVDLIKGLMIRIKDLSPEHAMSRSFTEWPHSAPTPFQMINAGWLHKPSLETGLDRVSCSFCGKSTFNWKPEHDPSERHRYCSPKCPFVLAVDSGLAPAETRVNLR